MRHLLSSPRRSLLHWMAFLVVVLSVGGHNDAQGLTDRPVNSPVTSMPPPCGGPNSGVGGWVGVYGDSAATTPCPPVTGGVTSTWWVVATLAGASACGIVGAEFRLVETSNPVQDDDFWVTWVPSSALISSSGDPLDFGSGGGAQVALTCPPSSTPGQRIVLGRLVIDATQLPGLPFPPPVVDIAVRGHSTPADPLTPFANFTRCDGVRVTMQRSDAGANASAFVKCGINVPTVAYVTNPAARNSGTLTLDIVGANSNLNPMTLIARLTHVAQPTVYATLVTPVSPGRVTAVFPVDALPTGPWDLQLSTDAGSATLDRAVVLYDEAVTLRRVTSHPTDIRIATTGPLAPFDSLAFSRTGGLYVTSTNSFDTGVTHRVVQGTFIKSPTWSPGADRLGIDGKTGDSQIEPVLRATGVSVGPAFAGATPAWSPLADRIAFELLDDTDTNAIFTVDLSGQNLAQLTLSGLGAGEPAWSPDGKRIAFRRANQVLVVSAALREAAGVRTVATLTNPQWGQSWSPDGRWIAYSDTRSGNADIYVRGSRETQYGEYRITADPGSDFNPVWTRDGNGLAFVSSRSGENNAYVATSLPFRVDTDGDVALDAADACPAGGPPPLGKTDRDLDGCADPAASFRNMRFWSADRLPFHFEIHPTADAAITDGSDIQALTSAVSTWNTAAGFTAIRDTPADTPAIAVAGDGRNTMTFLDPNGYKPGFLAIAVVTSIAGGDTVIDGTWYRPGEIVDADILFNSATYTFTTPSYHGLGQPASNMFDLQSVATHEAGHLLGLAHSSVKSSTMYYAVPHDTSFRTLSRDDKALVARTYGSPAVNASGRIQRSDGVTAIPGAAVIAIGTATGDTLQMTVTGLDGGYSFWGATENFKIYVQPIDGGPEIGGLAPGSVGREFAGIAQADFVPEYWDGPAETNADTGTGVVVVAPGPTLVNADVIINADLAAPVVTAFTPANGATNVPVTTILAAKFNDRIDLSSISGTTVQLRANGTQGVAGAAGLLQRDSLIAFTPTSALQYSTSYTFSMGPGIRDRFGNAMPSAASATFTTEAQPALTLTSVSPVEIPVSGILVIQGTGFNPIAAANTVHFAGNVTAIPTGATPVKLYVKIPTGAVSGNVTVTSGQTSNALPITVVASRQPPTMSSLGSLLIGTVRSLTLSAGGAWAYIATSQGVTAVDASPVSGLFLQATPMLITGGVTAVAALGDGRHVIAIGPVQPRFRLLETDLVNRTHQVSAAASLADMPLGVAALPGGDALVVDADRVVQISTLGVNAGQEVREWTSPDVTFEGSIAVAGDGRTAYAAATDGRMLILGLQPGETVLHIGFGSTAPREIAVPPAGGRFFTVDELGVVRIGDNNATIVKEIALGGGFKSMAISPEGEIAYCADFIQNQVQVLDIQQNNLQPMTLFPTGRDPVAIATGASGRYIYLLANSHLEVYDTQTGPIVKTISPSAGGPGTHVTITGSGFSPSLASNSVVIGGVAVVPLSTNTTGTRLVAVQDAAATTGTVQVTVAARQSNAAPYRVVNRTNSGAFLPDIAIGTFTQSGGGRLLMSPDGKWLFARDPIGTLTVIVSDPNSALHSSVVTLTASQTLLSSDGAMAMSRDGTQLFAADPVASRIRVYSFDPALPFLFHYTRNIIASGVDETFIQPSGLVLSPNGKYLFVRVATSPPQIWLVDTTTDTGAFTLPGLTRVGGFAMHPDGATLYISDNLGGGTVGVRAVNADPTRPAFGATTAFITTSPQTSSTTGPIVADPDGSRIIVNVDVFGSTTHTLNVIDTNPASPTFNVVLQGLPVSSSTTSTPVMAMNGSGTVVYMATANTLWAAVNSTGSFLGLAASRAISTSPLNLVVSADDARLYYNALKMAYLTAPAGVAIASSPSLVALRNTLVSDAFAVRVSGGTPGNPVDGTLVKFNGSFRQLLPWGVLGPPGVGFGVADANGFVRAPQYLVSATTTVSALVGAAGVNFSVTAILDTIGAPQLIAVHPGTADSPGIQTAVVVDFSKSVRPSTVNVGSLTLRTAGTTVPALYSLVNNNRRAVVRPLAPLALATVYTVDVQGGILDHSGAAVSNPGTRTFTTSATVSPLRLLAIEPPAAPVGSPIVISGTGFPSDYTQARVRFGTTTITPVSGDGFALRAYVPSEATTSPVRVVAGTDSTAARSFVVLPAGGTPVNDVIGTITAPSSGHHIAIVPDGTRAYMTCPGSGTVVPMRILDQVAEAAIPVGVYPFGVAASPDGRWVYVTNFRSNEVTVIDATPTSVDFQRVVNRFAVGANPTGIAVNPNGRRVYVANYMDGTVSIVDTDSASANYLRPIAIVNVGSRTQTVAITPDGARLLVGTSTGILVMDADNPNDPATAPIRTGGSSQIIVVTPDGGYAVVLASDGQLYLIDLSNSSVATAPIRTGGSSQIIVVSPDGGEVYVTNSDGTVQVFSIVSILANGGGASWRPRTLIGFTPLSSIAVGENPIGMAFDRRSGKLFVVNAGSRSVSMIDVATTQALDQTLPLRLALGRPMPNPSRGVTSFGLDLPSAQEVNLRIFSVDGRLIREMAVRRLLAGRHILTWDGRTTSGSRAATGVYFAVVRAGDWSEHLKIVLLR